jgi:hypothetical protein
MSIPPDGEYLLIDVHWRRRDRDEALRPLHGFTTGHLAVEGGSAHLKARFNDQFLSNRFSDLESDRIPVLMRVGVLETDDPYALACSAPTLDRAGASYRVEVDGDFAGAESASAT